MSKRYTTEEFIEKAKKIHGDRYDYNKVNYINSKTDVIIICPKHGEFEQNSHSHLQNHGCPYCGESKKLTTKKFIKKSKKVHGDKYDYSLVEYKNAKTKVKIICPIHGEFKQQPYSHHMKSGCPNCAKNVQLSIGEFIKKSKKVHGDKYDYSLVEIKNSKIKIKIICHKHGIFEQTPNSHLNKNGCPKCAGNNLFTKEIFIKKSNKVHGNKYNYNKVFYRNNITKVKIICSEHGEFEQTPVSHYGGSGCPKCAVNAILTKEIFIEKSKEIHGNKYDYSLTKYTNCKSKVKIICLKHGIFLQTPDNHQRGNGCPICLESMGEMKISRILEKYKIKFIREYKFNDCKYKQKLPFDFYLPEPNICIEFDGEQHFKSCKCFGGINEFELRKIRDNIKNEYCKNNNIQLIRIKYNENINDKLIDLFKT